MNVLTKYCILGDDISVLLDTSFLVAFYDLDDVKHARAVELLAELEAGSYGGLFISDYIFDETITLLKKYVGIHKTNEIGNYLLNSVEMANVDKEVFKHTWELSKKFEKLSFTDCSSICLIKYYNITYIATFDSDFSSSVNVLK